MMKTVKLNKSELVAVLVSIKKEAIQNHWYNDEREVQVTVGYTAPDMWDIQTGDNCFSGPAYLHPHWGVAYLYPGCNCLDIAAELIDQVEDMVYQ